MIVDDDTIDIAVLGVFFELQTPPDGRLAWTTLREEWPKAGLRAADLDEGVRRLVECKALRQESHEGDGYVVLTPDGYRRGRSFGTWERLFSAFWRRATVRLSRGRRGAEPRRRAGDGRGPALGR